ncbi:Tesmin/TSO1-like CXC domain-containing protein, putative isoform 2 [Hibiscus syriacus]|uniref:Tesmin/TSO1-like CXC domain-containing protein, putative isoform 2 n=1 Tax=Hibiscus syriacus TaxID=106335 RepID=A0A6A2YXX5_HIBSY|nr:Tesmin/TSO1-like CXC domain-containing protein, putative isoform 2 [Hibiscus syriacus]
MDTPDKTQITPTSLSKFEDSPVFKYIDSLSPIELAKSGHTNNAFNTLALLSPSSLFPSPQINCHRESSFSVERHHLSADSNSRVLQNSNQSNTSEEASKAVEQSDLYNEHLGCRNKVSSFKGISSNIFDEKSDLAIELPRTSKYNCGSPDGNLEPCDKILKKTSPEVAGQERSPFQRHRDEWQERQQSFESERDLRKIRRIKLSEESARCGWVAIVSDVADILTVNSANIIHENTDGQDLGMEDSGTTSFISNIPQILLDNSNNLENVESGDLQVSCEQNELGEPVTDQTSGILSTCLVDKLVLGDSGLKNDDKKLFNQLSRQRSIRRRCLVFEKSPGFGLHLTSLPNISKGDQSPNKSTLSSIKTGEVPCGSRAAVAENSSETPATVGDDDADHNTPEKKRHSASCKRCNCKRSKCLKLYCDCFAAGLYCIEPCSCLDCFNKPIHENVVLETRKQIEYAIHKHLLPKTANNHLADPVISSNSSDMAHNVVGETSKTPASARHKSGCNCKRSSCLKKYCECFQVGVGCSPSCRCEGCKNSFGRKDGCDESEYNEDGLEASEQNASDKNSHDNVIDKKTEEHRELSVPSDISRLPFAYSGKLTGSFLHSVTSPKSCTTHGSDFSSCMSKFDSNLQAILEDETPKVLKHKCLHVPKLNSSPTLRGCHHHIASALQPLHAEVGN